MISFLADKLYHCHKDDIETKIDLSILKPSFHPIHLMYNDMLLCNLI